VTGIETNFGIDTEDQEALFVAAQRLLEEGIKDVKQIREGKNVKAFLQVQAR